MQRYALNLVTMTWYRDSHGLFDFEMRHLQREHFIVTQDKNFIRKGSNCEPINFDIDIRT